MVILTRSPVYLVNFFIFSTTVEGTLSTTHIMPFWLSGQYSCRKRIFSWGLKYFFQVQSPHSTLNHKNMHPSPINLEDNLFSLEESQIMSPKNIPLWHIDYFEFKALKRHQVKGHSDTFSSKKFLSKYYLLAHNWKHTGEKHLECPKYGKCHLHKKNLLSLEHELGN